MTIIFRTSTFFLVIVITVKTFSVFEAGRTVDSGSRFEQRIEQLLDESLRRREEVEERAEKGLDLVLALYSTMNRSINWVREQAGNAVRKVPTLREARRTVRSALVSLVFSLQAVALKPWSTRKDEAFPGSVRYSPKQVTTC